MATQTPANVSFAVTNDWGTGFTAELTISNTGTTPINGWTLAFDAPYTIDQFWSSTLTKLPSGSYSVSPVSWNTSIPTGGSVTFGYRGSKTAGTAASAPTNYLLNGVSLSTGTPTPTPTVLPDLTISDATIAEGGLNANGQPSALFTVKLSQASTSPVTVGYATQNGTAIAGQDFTATQGTLSFAAGETSKTIAVPILNDTAAESTEGFSVVLSNPAQAKVLDGTGAGTITDNDATPPAATTTAPIATTFTVTGDWGNVFCADLVLRNTGTTPINGWTLKFKAPYAIDQWWNSTITKLPTGEYSVAPEAWTQSIAPGASVTIGFRANKAAGSTAPATAPTDYLFNGLPLNGSTTPPAVTLPNLTISDATIAEGALNASGAAAALFTVSLSQASTSPVTVDFATQNGTAIAGQDFTAASGKLTFAAGETKKTIAVPITNDTAVESSEQFNVVLSNATQAKITDAQGVGTITDNDSAPVTLPNLIISDATITEGALNTSGNAAALFTVTLSKSSTSPVTVDFATRNGTAIAGQDFTAASGKLTFAAGETKKTIAVPITNDTVAEPTENFQILLSNATQATIADATGVGTITDNDTTASTGNKWDYLGFNYASWWHGEYQNPESTQAMAQLKGVGADTATIVATYYLDGLRSSNIFSTNNTPTLADVEKAVTDAKSQGLAVWLKPHLDITTGEFRGSLDPTDRATFFSNYKTMLMNYARLGQKYNAEALVLGTELNGVTKDIDKAAWLDIIQSVKQVYTGKLTYAANWDAPDKIPFVSQLDMIGVDAYYPLTQNNNATVDQLVSAWTSTPEDSFVRQLTGGKSIVSWLQGISQNAGKPIVFTEAGFRSADGNAAAPYAFWGQNTVDYEEQSRLYQAFFKVFGGQAPAAGNVSWFDGAQMWSWYATTAMNNDPNNTDYPILNKPAENVFKQYAAQLLSGTAASSSTASLAASSTASPAPAAVLSSAPDPITNPNGLQYDFKVATDWGNGFSGDVLVTNTGTTPIENWALDFNAPYAISQAWNAQVTSLGSGQYEAKAVDAAPWNQVISPGETISFGFVGEAADPTSPSGFAMKTA